MALQITECLLNSLLRLREKKISKHRMSGSLLPKGELRGRRPHVQVGRFTGRVDFTCRCYGVIYDDHTISKAINTSTKKLFYSENITIATT